MFLRPDVVSFSCLAFSSGGRILLARIHSPCRHGARLEDVNKELFRRSLRPMTKQELSDFFETHKFTLAHLAQTEQLQLVATDPSSITVAEDGRTFTPGVLRKKWEMYCGDVAVHNSHIADCLSVISVDENINQQLCHEASQSAT